MLKQSLTAGALTLSLMAPASALAHGHAPSIRSEVKAGRAALQAVRRSAHASPAATRHALRLVAADAGAAARQSLAQHTPSSRAAGLRQVASLLAGETQLLTELLPTASGQAKVTLAAAVGPATAGETFVEGLLNQIAGELPAGSASGTLSAVSSLLNQTAGQLDNLASLIAGGSLPTQVTTVLGGAMGTDGASIGAIITQLEQLVPDLPTAEQATAAQLLTQLQGLLEGAAQTMTSTGTSEGSQFGAGIAQRLQGLGQFLSWLLGGLGQIIGSTPLGKGAAPGSTPTPSTGTTTTGTTTTGTTGAGGAGSTSTASAGNPLAGLLPAGLESLLGQSGSGFGFGGGTGSLPFGL
jgi:hypothetical protein